MCLDPSGDIPTSCITVSGNNEIESILFLEISIQKKGEKIKRNECKKCEKCSKMKELDEFLARRTKKPKFPW